MTGLGNPAAFILVGVVLGGFSWWWWRLLNRLAPPVPAATRRNRMTRERRRRVMLLDEHTCRYCERTGGLRDPDGKRWHIDHIVPLAKGGSDTDDDNLALACEGCNLRKGTRAIVPDDVMDGRGVIYASWADRHRVG